MKPTFLQYDRPLLTAMIQCETPTECIRKIRASLADGAEALGVQLCKLKQEYRTPEDLRAIFAACEDKPIYITSYRCGSSVDLTDEECADLLLLGLDCGATLCDVMGNLFDRDTTYLELTHSPTAIQKQKELIAEIHRRGGEVLMSSHTLEVLSVEETLTIAAEHRARGADIVKIVNRTDKSTELPLCIHTIQELHRTLDRPFLYLVNGPCHPFVRQIGPSLGVCMYLCVHEHGPLDTLEQPILRSLKAARENLKF